MSNRIFEFKTSLIKEILAKSNAGYETAISEVKAFIITDEGKEAYKKWLGVQPTVKKKYNQVKHISECF